MSGPGGNSNPAALWLARRDWAERRILDENRRGGCFVLVFALAWNGIAFAVAIAVWSSVKDRGPEHFFVMLFPLIGLFVLASAVYVLVRRARYGDAVFELATLPAPVGRALAGHVRVAGAAAGERDPHQPPGDPSHHQAVGEAHHHQRRNALGK